MSKQKLIKLAREGRACTECEAELPLGARPVFRVSTTARLMVIGQAPGTRVHATGIPWNDPSGDRLRTWLDMDRETFYDESQIAIMPMGFCYPGKGKSGDLPPRKECAPMWHGKFLELMPGIELTLLIGQYSQNYYLDDHYKTLTERVRNWQHTHSMHMPLPHPSPRNLMWLRKNPWFEKEVVPDLKRRVKALLKS